MARKKKLKATEKIAILANMPFKIWASPEGEYVDDEMYSHLPEDVLYVRVGNHPVDTALRLLLEQGYQVSIQAVAKGNDEYCGLKR